LGDEGKFFYEKHKLFLYKEDFEKFIDGLNEAIAAIRQIRSQEAMNGNTTEQVMENSFSDVTFEELGTK
jgi:hypothetical protein